MRSAAQEPYVSLEAIGLRAMCVAFLLAAMTGCVIGPPIYGYELTPVESQSNVRGVLVCKPAYRAIEASTIVNLRNPSSDTAYVDLLGYNVRSEFRSKESGRTPYRAQGPSAGPDHCLQYYDEGQEVGLCGGKIGAASGFNERFGYELKVDSSKIRPHPDSLRKARYFPIPPGRVV